MLISKVASGSLITLNPPRSLSQSAGTERQSGLSHAWKLLNQEINSARKSGYTIDSECSVYDEPQNTWISAIVSISEDGIMRLYLPDSEEVFSEISLHFSTVIGHVTKFLIQIYNESSDILIYCPQTTFAQLNAVLFTWSRMRPNGIYQKLWCPNTQTLSSPESDLLRCELKAHFTMFNPQLMHWAPFLARLKRNGDIQLYGTQDKRVFELKISAVLGSRIILVHPSLVNSNTVLLLFPDMGGPESVYLKFNDLDDFEDWLATLKSLSKQPIATPLSHDPLRCLRWYRTLKISVSSCQSDNVDLRGAYIDVCWNHWIFARTCINPLTDSASWNQTFEIPAPESAILGTVFPFQIQLKLKKCDYDGEIPAAEDDMTLGTVVLTASDGNKNNNWHDVENNVESENLIKLNANVDMSVVGVLDSSYYNKLRGWMSAVKLSLPLKLAKNIPSTEISKLVRICSDLYAAQGRQVEWVLSLVTDEVQNIDTESDTLFRGSSFMTRCIELLFQQQGEETLQRTVGNFIRKLLSSTNLATELDPSRLVVDGDLSVNQFTMKRYLTYLWSLIKNESLPASFCKIFEHMRIQLTLLNPDNEYVDVVMKRTLASFLFLRFYCPALLNPQLYGLSDKLVEPSHRRTLVLVAKILQGFANGVKFGSKESWLVPMNDFIEDNSYDLDAWYKSICGTASHNDASANYDRLPKQLPVDVFMGQYITSPNLIDEWATYAKLVDFVLNNKEDEKLQDALLKESLLKDLIVECEHISAKKEVIMIDLEKEDTFEDSVNGSNLELYFNKDTSLFGLNQDLLEATSIPGKEQLINSDKYPQLNHINKDQAGRGKEGGKERHKTSSVRRLTQLLKLILLQVQRA